MLGSASTKFVFNVLDPKLDVNEAFRRSAADTTFARNGQASDASIYVVPFTSTAHSMFVFEQNARQYVDIAVDNGSVRVAKGAIFGDGTLALATKASVIADAKRNVDNAKTQTAKQRAQVSYNNTVDAFKLVQDDYPVRFALQHAGDVIIQAPTAFRHLADSTLIPVVRQALQKQVNVSIKGVNITAQVIDSILAKGVVRLQVLKQRLTTAPNAYDAGRTAGNILSVATLFDVIRRADADSGSLRDYFQRYADDVALMAVRTADFPTALATNFSTYDHATSVGRAILQIAGATSISNAQADAMTLLFEDALFGSMTSVSTGRSNTDAGDYIYDRGATIKSTASDNAVVTFSDGSTATTSNARLVSALTRSDIESLRQYFHQAIANAYYFMFGTDAPHALKWAGLGDVYLTPIFKVK